MCQPFLERTIMYKNMGRKCTDSITGFSGVVTAYAEYITGCNQLLLTPKTVKKGEMKRSSWVDEQRVVFSNKKAVVLDNSESPGFGPEAPIR